MTEARQQRGTALALRDPLPWVAFQGLVSRCESSGYVVAFLPEIFGRDALVALSALAGSTDRLMLGTGIIPMTSRTPLLTAMAAASLQERSGGRLILGLGTGPAVSGALDRLRELIGQLRRLCAGEPVEIDGRTRRLSLVPQVGVRLSAWRGRIAKSKCLNRTRLRAACGRRGRTGGVGRGGRLDHRSSPVRQGAVRRWVCGSNARLSALPANGLKELLRRRARQCGRPRVSQ